MDLKYLSLKNYIFFFPPPMSYLVKSQLGVSQHNSVHLYSGHLKSAKNLLGEINAEPKHSKDQLDLDIDLT